LAFLVVWQAPRAWGVATITRDPGNGWQ
jgi:hypothetical protein